MDTEQNLSAPPRAPEGRFVTRDGRRLYEITHVDEMPAFLMTLVGDADLWAYLSTSGGLTAGRVEPDRCLFPYETDDRLHDAGGRTGPVTLVRGADGTVWRPLDMSVLNANLVRRLLRTPVGDAVIFEETDTQRGLTFRAEWGMSDVHGLIRRCELELSADAEAIDIELLDGFVNVMPASVVLGLNQAASTLVDAYKRSEFDDDLSLAVYALEAAISDGTDACESLRANVIWRTGLDGATVTLREDAVRDFESGRAIHPEHLVTGRRGAYLCHTRVHLEPGQSERWTIVGDVHVDHAALTRRRRWLASAVDRDGAINESLRAGAERLAVLLDQTDGAQASADESACAAHRSNVLFNAMRAGIPPEGETCDPAEFRRFVHARHAGIAARHDGFVAGLGAKLSLSDRIEVAASTGDPQLVRLAMEFLPLTFGRRHGDPSRPWNRFRIPERRDDGSRTLGYEGNWRDIFQNWEAVCRSHPDMLPSVIAKFVNASTADGHNPYRISEAGIDWEVPDPYDPWANIGYWGDHQLIYLLRLLMQLRDTKPASLDDMLEDSLFSYADVPYVIRPFDALVRDPRASIIFDHERNESICARAEKIGADARLIEGDNGEPLLVTLLEKLVVTTLAKVSNLVPGGGIWMNTQRPEWNDANNALAGYGLSMVTLYYLRRFAAFCHAMIEDLPAQETPISDAVAKWSDQVLQALQQCSESGKSAAGTDDATRWSILENLGRAAARTRERVAERGLGQVGAYPMASLTELFRLIVEVCDQSIANARRPDGLYESYNVLEIDEESETASVQRLHAMLEGQVAVLSAGVLDAQESLAVLDALFSSALYREDQHTFMLYPRVDRPSFAVRNVIPEDAVKTSPLLQRALHEGEHRIAVRDEEGQARFCSELVSHRELSGLIEALTKEPEWRDCVREDNGRILDAYESTFAHSRFTGRSGTMHKYEGIGSIYWHMVSKLLLAVQECVFDAIDRGDDPAIVDRLRAAYTRVRFGLGMHKTPGVFGAVPHEPYSHTPWGRGAQQPGMTGQVKEGVLTRFGEVGVRLIAGELHFDPTLLEHDELLQEAVQWRVRGVHDQEVDVPAGAIGFSVCATPFVLRGDAGSGATVTLANGTSVELDHPRLDTRWTEAILGRTGEVMRVEIRTPLPLD